MSTNDKPAGGSEDTARPGTVAVPEAEGRRQLAFQLESVTLRESKSGDGSIHLAGHAAVFDQLSHDLGGFREKIDPGAFTEVLGADPDVHLVVGHDMTRVLARTRSKTLELHEDEDGLRVWARLDPSDPDVMALVPKMRRGDVDQMSFAFTVRKDTWLIEGEDDEERITRTIHEIDGLYDVSVVAQGAYPQTDANLRGLLESARSSGRLVREAVGDTQDVEPTVADEESGPQGDLAPDEKRTTAEAEPPAGSSGGDHSDDETRATDQELRTLQAYTRTETELAKRRLLEASR